jgi:hypothetical protein
VETGETSRLSAPGNVKFWLYQGAERPFRKFALCWDDKNLYLGAVITDDALACANSSDSIYMGDSIQIALSQEALGKGWFELSLGQLKGGKTIANCFIAPSNDHPTGEMKDVKVVVRRQDTTTTYEVAIRDGTRPDESKQAPFFFSLW